jgi:polysaccharide export outer membrane protein
MKILRLPLSAIAGLFLAAGAHAQMSTFPSPPPLPPLSQSSGSSSGSGLSLAPPADSTSSSAGRSSGANANPPRPPATAATLNSMEALDDKTPLQDGDTISFRVIEDRDEAVQRVVGDTGQVDFPYIGLVKVEGKTCRAAAIEVKKLLEVDYYKQATVIIGLDLIVGQDNDTKPKDFAWVMGEVKEVGPEELLEHQPMTVSQLIIRAGGFGDFADQRKVKLVHHVSAGADAGTSKDAEVVDVKSIMDGKPAPDPLVKPGDYIIVPKKFFNAE